MSARNKYLQDDDQGDGIPAWLKIVIVLVAAYLITKY